MLVQALTSYARTYLSDQLADPAFEEKPVAYALQILRDGTFAGIREYAEESLRGKKAVRVVPPMSVPRSPINRNTGIFPLLGCDAIQYVLGANVGVWTEADKQENHRERHTAFVDVLCDAADETNDPDLQACVAFYGSAPEVKKAVTAMAELQPKPGTLIALAVLSSDPGATDPGGPVIRRKGVRGWWRQRYGRTSAERMARGGDGVCLVCGKLDAVAPTHDKIKGLATLGGQPSGVSLMSFDKEAFRSYGWEQNANSPVCPDCATAYVLAFNDLLHTREHRRGASRDVLVPTRFDCGGVAFIYWTKEPSDDDVAALFAQANPRQVARLFGAPFSGGPAGDLACNDFYFVAVSGNGGRLLIRYWFHDSLAHVHAALHDWFLGLRIADVFKQGAASAPPKLWELLAVISTAPRNKSPIERARDVPVERSMQLARRALHGLPLGRTILAAALSRLGVEGGPARLSATRMGLVRLCLNDIEGIERKGDPLMGETLNGDLAHPAYVCGRLLAVYDRLQYAAQGDVNTTVADRYYAMASAYPTLAFPKLETLSKAHLKKLRRDNPGAAVNIERQIRELVGMLAGTFPPPFSLESQGRFAIGFHHQKADDARRATEARAARVSADTSGN